MFKKPLQPLVQIHGPGSCPLMNPLQSPPDFPRGVKTPQNHFKVMVRSQQESRASSVEAPDEPLWVTLLGGFVGTLAFLVTWIFLA